MEEDIYFLHLKTRNACWFLASRQSQVHDYFYNTAREPITLKDTFGPTRVIAYYCSLNKTEDQNKTTFYITFNEYKPAVSSSAIA